SLIFVLPTVSLAVVYQTPTATNPFGNGTVSPTFPTQGTITPSAPTTVTIDANPPAFTRLSCQAKFEGIAYIVCRAQEILNSIIPVLMTLGLVYFIWGV